MRTPVYFLIRARGAFEFFDRCIDSIFSQTDQTYTILYIDDFSPLLPYQKNHIRKKLRDHIVQFNTKRKYAVRNAHEAIHRHVPDDAIVVGLDGDDWLIRNDVIDIIRSTYNKTGCVLTYGNCVYHKPNDPLHNTKATDVHPFANTRYPKDVELKNAYTRVPFRPLHPKTWNAGVFKSIPQSAFCFPNGAWLRYCEDQAIMYPMLEKAGGNYSVIPTPLSAYNMSHTNSDAVRHGYEKIADEVSIRRTSGARQITGIRELKPHPNNFFVSYSPYTKGIVGAVFLLLQIVACWLGFAHRIYLGNQRRLEKVLCAIVESKTGNIIIQSPLIGYSASQFTKPTIGDYLWEENNQADTFLLQESIMWTLVFCKSITARLERQLAEFGVKLRQHGLVQSPGV